MKIAISFKMTIWVILEWPFNLGPFLNISQCKRFLKNDIRFLVYWEPFDRNLKVSNVILWQNLKVKFKYDFQKVLALLCKRVPPYREWCAVSRTLLFPLISFCIFQDIAARHSTSYTAQWNFWNSMIWHRIQLLFIKASNLYNIIWFRMRKW